MTSPLSGVIACGHLQRLREARVLHDVAPLAMDRHRDLRLGPHVHAAQLVAARMAGDVDVELARSVTSLMLRSASMFWISPIDALIARNDARGEDHRVVRAKLHGRMIAARDARQRRVGLALAAGAEIKDVLRRQVWPRRPAR